MNRRRSRQLHDALQKLTKVIREVEAALQTNAERKSTLGDVLITGQAGSLLLRFKIAVARFADTRHPLN